LTTVKVFVQKYSIEIVRVVNLVTRVFLEDSIRRVRDRSWSGWFFREMNQPVTFEKIMPPPAIMVS
jgi:hypothetical protein